MNIRGMFYSLVCAGLIVWGSIANALPIDNLTENGDGTVTDSRGLMWLQTPGPDSGWETAVEYATTRKVGGYTDWRLPSALDFITGDIDLVASSINNEFGYLYGIDIGVAETGQYPGSLDPLVNYIGEYFWTDTEGDDEDAYAFFWSTEQTWQIDHISDYNDVYHVTAVRDASSDPQSIPEPGSMMLTGLGLAGLFWVRRRRLL